MFTVNIFAAEQYPPAGEPVAEPREYTDENVFAETDDDYSNDYTYDYIPDPLKNYPDPEELELMIKALPTHFDSTLSSYPYTWYFDNYCISFCDSVDNTYEDGSMKIRVVLWDTSYYNVYLSGKSSGGGYHTLKSEVNGIDESYTYNKGLFYYYWNRDTLTWDFSTNVQTCRAYGDRHIYSTVELTYDGSVIVEEGNSAEYNEYLESLDFTYPLADGLKAVWVVFGDIINAIPYDIYLVVFWIFAAVIIIGVLRAF